MTIHSPFDQPSYGKKKKKAKKKAKARKKAPAKKSKKAPARKKAQKPTKKQANYLAALQNKIDKILGEDWGGWTGERILYDAGADFSRTAASAAIATLERDLASLQEWVEAGRPKGWVVGKSEKKAKKKKAKKAKKKKAKRHGERVSKKVKISRIPSTWPRKWNRLYEYATRLAKRYKDYKPRGQGSRHPLRQQHIAIDPYTDFVYVRFMDTGPGARGQRIYGIDIVEQEHFKGRMTTVDAMAIGKALSAAANVSVDVDSSKRNAEDEKDRGRIIFRDRDAPAGWIYTSAPGYKKIT